MFLLLALVQLATDMAAEVHRVLIDVQQSDSSMNAVKGHLLLLTITVAHVLQATGDAADGGAVPTDAAQGGCSSKV
jgi:hypothetical protein